MIPNPMKSPVVHLFVLMIVAGLDASAQAQSGLITFEDLHTADYVTNSSGDVSPRPLVPLSPVMIANGYHGLRWNNLYAVDGLLAPDQIDNAAPSLSVVSGYNNAISFSSTAEISSPSSFNLTSGYFNSLAAFNLNLEVQGYNGDILMYDQTYTLAPTDQSILTEYFTNLENLCFSPQPLLLNLELNNVTDVRFIASGGQLVRANPSGGTFAMDDLTVSSPVPEPAVLALEVAGGLGLWAAFRRRKASLCAVALRHPPEAPPRGRPPL